MLSGLHVHGLGGILVLAATFAVAPNLSLLGTAYLMGPGFAIGTGTIVSPTDVVLGPVPAVPFVSAIPEGTPPWWASLLVVLPVVLAVLVAVRTTNAYPVRSFPESILRGLLTGGFAVFVTTVSVFLAGGAIGPGRMQHTGASGSAMLVASTILLMSGALVGSLVAGWRQIRGRSSGADQ
jgi:hypothetical protein